MKLKYKDIPRVKKEITYNQDGLCAICKRQLDMLKNRDICLDHNHKTGRIRGVLCRGCNSMEGKVFRAFQRVGLHKQGVDYMRFLKGLEMYYFNYEVTKGNPTNYIHPKFKEKKVKNGE